MSEDVVPGRNKVDRADAADQFSMISSATRLIMIWSVPFG